VVTQGLLSSRVKRVRFVAKAPHDRISHAPLAPWKAEMQFASTPRTKKCDVLETDVQDLGGLLQLKQ
jgi:hypothetical protein